MCVLVTGLTVEALLLCAHNEYRPHDVAIKKKKKKSHSWLFQEIKFLIFVNLIWYIRDEDRKSDSQRFEKKYDKSKVKHIEWRV